MQPNEQLTRHSSRQMRAQLLPEILRKTLMVRAHRETHKSQFISFGGGQTAYKHLGNIFFFFFFQNVKQKVAVTLQIVWLYLCVILKEEKKKQN